MNVWTENIASRGSIEIASCLIKWIETYVLTVPDHPRNLRIFADNCGGQNKNILVTLALLQEIHLKHFDRIELCYLVAGHSFSACDRAFGNIDGYLKKYSDILSPQSYCSKIQHSRIKKDYPLYRMKSEDFLNFDVFIKDKIAYKKRVEDKAFLTAAQIVLTSEYPLGYILKSAYNIPDSSGLKVRAAHPKLSESNFDLSQVVLPPKYPQERKLDAAKLKDLEYLTQYMCEAEGLWIKNLVERQKSETVQALVYESVDEEDEIELEQDDNDYEYDDHVRRIS